MKRHRSTNTSVNPEYKDQHPKVYLAGKVRKNCWRTELVPGLREHAWSMGPLRQPAFTYVGPFFVGCDHGCYHGENSHGVLEARSPCACSIGLAVADFDTSRYEIASLCLDAITKSDLVFCYIDSFDCYGTLVEIGWAHAHGVPVIVVFAPGFAGREYSQFWFMCAKARSVVYDIDESSLRECFEGVLRRYIC